MSENWWQYEICIMFNNKSQCSVANRLRCDESLHYKFITQFADVRIFKIGEHSAQLQAKWLIVSYTLFALHFCPQRCRTRQISKITCVLLAETVTNCCYIDRLMWVYYQQLSNCCRPVLTYWRIDWRHQWLTDCWYVGHFASTSFSLM